MTSLEKKCIAVNLMSRLLIPNQSQDVLRPTKLKEKETENPSKHLVSPLFSHSTPDLKSVQCSVSEQRHCSYNYGLLIS